MATLYSKTANGLVPINRGYNVIIEDSLNSSHTDRALSAKQGKTLKDAIDENTSALGGISFVTCTAAEYEAITVKDPNTLYIIVPEE